MGLDMYLVGEKVYSNYPEPKLKEDGYPVEFIGLDLGYWRKHPNLHGYIVKNFADGVDECQKIYLDEVKLEKLISGIKNDELPTTTGFFFGQSLSPGDPGYQNQKERDIEILNKALNWLKSVSSKNQEFVRRVYYQASW